MPVIGAVILILGLTCAFGSFGMALHNMWRMTQGGGAPGRHLAAMGGMAAGGFISLIGIIAGVLEVFAALTP